MLKHVVAHRSNSSLGGNASNSSCLSSLPPCGPSSVVGAPSSVPPIRRASLSACESRTRSYLSPSDMRTRSSLSSTEMRPRLVYRRIDTNQQPYTQIQALQGTQKVLENEEQQKENNAEEPPKIPTKDGESNAEQENLLNVSLKMSETCVEKSDEMQPDSKSYTPVYPTRFGHNRDAYYDYLRNLTTKCQQKQQEPLIDTNNEKHSNVQDKKSFVDKINEQDSYPSSANQFEEDDYPLNSTFRTQRLPPSVAGTSFCGETFPLEKTERFSARDSAVEREQHSSYREPTNIETNYSAGPLNSIIRTDTLSRNPNDVRKHQNLSLPVPNISSTASPKFPQRPPNCNLRSDSSNAYRALPRGPLRLVGTIMSKSMPSSNHSSNYLDPNVSLPRSSTLPRRDFKEEVRRSSIRSNTSSCSFFSSISCTSLTNQSRILNSRASSISSLSETIPVKVYLRRLRPDMEYKTVSLSSQTTCRELIVSLLTKFRLRHRDPNLFFILMEVTVRGPSDDAPVKRLLVLDDNARPAELQQCRPKGEARFSVGVRRGGLVRVHDSILMPGSQYKSLMVAYHTNSEELVQLMLKCYNCTENPINYALHELCKNPYSDRLIAPDECPLVVQSDWPRNNRANWAFILRRNLAYAFSLKSRMTWRRSIDQSSTDTESEFDERSSNVSSVVSYSNRPQQSRSSSISSASSVSSACSSSSSENSLDSGYLGSPLSGCKISTNTSEKKIDSRTLRVPHVTPKSVIPVTANVSKMSLKASLPSVSSVPTTVASSNSTVMSGKKSESSSSMVNKIPSNFTSAGRMIPINFLPRRLLRPIIPPPSLKVCLPQTDVTTTVDTILNRSSSTSVSKLDQVTKQSELEILQSESSATSSFSKQETTLSSNPSITSSFRPYQQHSSAQNSNSPSAFQEINTQNKSKSTEVSGSTSKISYPSPPLSAEKKLLDAIESLKHLTGDHNPLKTLNNESSGHK